MAPASRATSALDTVLEAWTLSMRAQGLADRTITERRRVIARLAKTTDPLDLTPTTLTAWLADLPTPATRHTYYTVARAWTHWLHLTGRRTDDPAAAVPRPRTPRYRPRPITDDQLAAVLALPLRRRTRTMIILAAYAGLRAHEIAKIRGEDIDTRAGTITITGKGGRTDTLPAHALVLQAAADHPRRGWWFPSPVNPDRPITAKNVGAVIAAALRRAGVNATAHQLRHRFATALLRGGADSRIVQTLMRHESLATTALYLAVDADQQTTALNALA